MEFVGAESNVWMSPSQGIRDDLFSLVSWVEDKFNPSKVS